MKDHFCDLLMEERPDFKLLNNGVESMTNELAELHKELHRERVDGIAE